VLDKLDNDRDSNTCFSTSTPLDSARQYFPLRSEDNITRHHPNVRIGFDQRKNCNVKPDKFDGCTSWSDFKSRFDICTGWTTEEKGIYLAVALRGRAQSVLGSRCRIVIISSCLGHYKSDFYRLTKLSFIERI
jgi:hypothetical protein